MKYDYLIVGAGLFGSTFARLATDKGKKCLVIDQRPHAGGNIYCEETEGINVHKYGAHIFHTSNERTWRFVNSYVEFNRFTNSPIAKAPDGRMYNLPFNMNTFYQIWGVQTPAEANAMLESQRAEAIAAMHADGADTPRNLEEQALTLIGRDVYELLIKGYTEKQWGRSCRELPAFIIRRLPVRLTFDNNYFNDKHQGIPIGGYNRLIDALLAGADVKLGEDYFTDRRYWDSMAEKTVYTGRIDQYYDFRYGRLDYRTVRLDSQIIDTPNFQGNAVVNYTSAEVPYTRIIEHKHFETESQGYAQQRTVISYEYPAEWAEGLEPFYPVNDAANQEKYKLYRQLADREERVIFGGRLAEYRYYDMAPVIERAMELADASL